MEPYGSLICHPTPFMFMLPLSNMATPPEFITLGYYYLGTQFTHGHQMHFYSRAVLGLLHWEFSSQAHKDLIQIRVMAYEEKRLKPLLHIQFSQAKTAPVSPMLQWGSYSSGESNVPMRNLHIDQYSNSLGAFQ